jgi:hypothetical protein
MTSGFNAELTTFLVLSISLTFVMFVFQTSIDNIGLEVGLDNTANIGFNYEESSIRDFDSTGNYDLNTDIAGAVQSLPTENNKADVDEGGNIFTDTFRSVRNWLLDITGIKYVINILQVWPNFFTGMFTGDYKPIGFAIGWFWNVAMVFALIFWIKGGSK